MQKDQPGRQGSDAVAALRSFWALYQGQRRRYVLIRRGDDWLVDNIQVYGDHKAAWIRSAL